MLPEIAINDRTMFDSSANETLNRQPCYIEMWLHIMEVLLKQIQKERRGSKPPGNTQNILQYFKPQPETKLKTQNKHKKMNHKATVASTQAPLLWLLHILRQRQVQWLGGVPCRA